MTTTDTTTTISDGARLPRVRSGLHLNHNSTRVRGRALSINHNSTRVRRRGLGLNHNSTRVRVHTAR